MGSYPMILLDTHIWVWWVHGEKNLTHNMEDKIKKSGKDGLGISIISCWEVAKLVEYQRLKLPCSVSEWIEIALNYPGIHLLDLSPQIAIESTQLPGIFHRDPADQIIVATSRILDYPILTADERIIKYPFVKKV
jgi:PIN domain nuclease of toxin-antitoxin system